MIRKSILWIVLQLIIMNYNLNGQNLINQKIIINSEKIKTDIGSIEIVKQLIEPDILKKQNINKIVVWQYRENQKDVFKSSLHSFNKNGYCTSKFIYGINHKIIWNYNNDHLVDEVISSSSKKLLGHIKFYYEKDTLQRIVNKKKTLISDTCRVCSYFSEQIPKNPQCQDTCIITEIKYKYDEQNNIVESTKQIFFQDDYYEKIIQSFTYNKRNGLTEHIVYGYTYKYFYNWKGKIKKRIKYFSSGGIAKEVIYKYDFKNRLKSQQSFHGNYGEIIEYTYDQDGLILTWTVSSIKKKFFGFDKTNIRFRRVFEYSYFE